ncbi:hypothetical protein BDY21DRAFT_200671 [Lineolata rhizophorae]|uniref:Uncharacterized protein n=1 Tax=Lineolata rhizophorae TaxID=578093 RepID=A0A6A6P5A6_9PEZI|nr:hypothetical protein BDY21DRAFT_200671 [Lineolata rhizophorae]
MRSTAKSRSRCPTAVFWKPMIMTPSTPAAHGSARHRPWATPILLTARNVPANHRAARTRRMRRYKALQVGSRVVKKLSFTKAAPPSSTATRRQSSLHRAAKNLRPRCTCRYVCFRAALYLPSYYRRHHFGTVAAGRCTDRVMLPETEGLARGALACTSKPNIPSSSARMLLLPSLSLHEEHPRSQRPIPTWKTVYRICSILDGWLITMQPLRIAPLSTLRSQPPHAQGKRSRSPVLAGSCPCRNTHSRKPRVLWPGQFPPGDHRNNMPFPGRAKHKLGHGC